MSELVGVALDLAPGPGLSGALPARWPQGQVAWPTGGVVRLGPVELAVSTTTLGSGRRAEMVLRNPRAGRPVALGALRLALGARPRRVLEHGWQSWSPVTRRQVGETMPLRRLAPAWVRGTYHAAPELAGRAVCGDHFLLMADGCGPTGTDGGLAGFLHGARHLATAVATQDGVTVTALLDGVVLQPGEEWPLDPLWLAHGDPALLYTEYLGHWAATAGARAGGASPFGWSSWYHYFWKVDPAGCRANLDLAAGHGLELFQLDDGYQRAVGDWLEPNDRFAPDAVPDLAERVAAAGLQSGIWTAPFLASPASRVARRHPDWLARRATGSRPGGRESAAPCRAMWNPLAWKGWALALDTTNPAVLDHLRETFARLTAQGWTYHKIDFCYAAAMPARRAGDGRLTRAQALRAGLQAVRDGIGEESALLGCGIPLAQSVGLVDAMRVSPDTGPSWRPGLLRLPGYPDLAPSAVAALQVGVLRAPMHRRLWVNDPDCLLLRPVATKLTPDQRQVLAATVAGTGAFTLLSDDLATYGDAEWSLVEQLRRLHRAGDTQMRLEDPFAPAPRVVGEGGLSLDVSWEGRTPAPPAPGAARIEGGSPPDAPWARLSSLSP